MLLIFLIKGQISVDREIRTIEFFQKSLQKFLLFSCCTFFNKYEDVKSLSEGTCFDGCVKIPFDVLLVNYNIRKLKRCLFTSQ